MIVVETCPKCGEQLCDEVICTYPPIPAKRCMMCGWYWEGTPEKIEYRPFIFENENKMPEKRIAE